MIISEPFYVALLLVIVFHILDIFFTIKIILKLNKKYSNATNIELNYHKFFLNKFGIIKGAFISGTISLSFLIILIILFQKDSFMLGIIIGIVFMPAYANYLTYINYDRLKLKKKSQNINSRSGSK